MVSEGRGVGKNYSVFEAFGDAEKWSNFLIGQVRFLPVLDLVRDICPVGSLIDPVDTSSIIRQLKPLP